MNIKKGDNVIVTTGKDKGKTGKVVRVLPSLDRIIVEGINLRKKHSRPTKSNQKGQVIDKTMPIHASNVMIYDSSLGKGVRVGRKVVGEKRVRFNKKSGATLD